MFKEDNGQLLQDTLGIAKERADKLVNFCFELTKRIGEHKEFKDETAIIKYITEQAMSQEFTTTELVWLTYKTAMIIEILYPSSEGKLIRLVHMLDKQKE